MLKGRGVSVGIGFGNVVILRDEEIKITKNKVKDVEHELEYFNKCYNDVLRETEEMIKDLSGTELEIMQAYLIMMQDPTLTNQTINLIQNEQYNVIYATEEGFNSIIDLFKNMDDPYMSERSFDIADIKNRVLNRLLNRKTINLGKLEKNTIIVAKELKTSDTAKLNYSNVSGIITEIGGSNSHVSIMARNHAIPAVARISDITKILRDGDFIGLDGQTGEVFVNPSEDEYQMLLKKKETFDTEKVELEKYRDIDPITADGYRVEVMANAGVPDDIDLIKTTNAEGIGLLRSEFIYMDSPTIPTEEEQFKQYKSVVMQMGGKEVIVRTLDIGGDKELKSFDLPKETNPFLGYRAIRICLDRITVFKAQLRALLRASVFGNLSIMFPMIATIEELREAKDILEDCKKELRSENIDFNENIKVGIMIEIPSAALTANELARECDFFSIGTNDLIQYTVAAERGNEKVANIYNKYNPGVIRLIKMAIDGAHQAGIKCGMCGEAAGDAHYIPLLLGLGLDEFSMNASSVLRAKKIITNMNKKDCEILANEILKMSSSTEIEKTLKK